jgi:hypothetical protein
LRDYQSVVTDISSPLSVRAVKFRQIFNLAGSANEFVNLTEISTDGDIEDCRRIQQEGHQRDALHEFHWLPRRHGALLKTLPVHEPNNLYDTTLRLFTLQSPFRMVRRSAPRSRGCWTGLQRSKTKPTERS